jgi:histidinol-phosphatase
MFGCDYATGAAQRVRRRALRSGAVPDDLALALELADLADSLTLSRYRSDDLMVETKPDLTPVTEADRGVEQAIRAQLAAVRPDDAVLGEEFGAEAARAGARRWIIDPIDGTKNYVRGIPVWATLLALEVEEELVAGVASAPALGRRWWASRGNGAFAADGRGQPPRPMRVSRVRSLDDAQLSFSGLRGWEQSVGVEALLRLGRACWRTRGFGDFWSYMLVAEGAAEIACEPEVSLWDLAAPKLIVEEAGGQFTDLGGVARADGGDALATNGLLHEAALAIVGR